MTTESTHTSPSLSPVSSTYTNDDEPSFENAEFVANILSNLGFKHLTKITETLQGNIWRGVRQSNSGKLISSAIKVTEKHLHENAQCIIDGVAYYIDENIITEQAILKYLTRHKDCPDTIVKYHGFYMSDVHYYLLMEDGGSSLFTFVEKAHELIRNGNIDINHWKQVIKVILRQMIECIRYIHSKNVCHFDISLENFLINDVDVNVQHKEGQKDKLHFVLENIRIKLIDFGLSELFENKHCRSNKFCGKTGYQSPEMFFEDEYSAKKNDVWALGICLFMMTSGIAPWSVAKTSNDAFAFVEKHCLNELLKRWNILSYFDDYLVYLLGVIFQYESDRITIKNIKQFVDQFM